MMTQAYKYLDLGNGRVSIPRARQGNYESLYEMEKCVVFEDRPEPTNYSKYSKTFHMMTFVFETHSDFGEFFHLPAIQIRIKRIKWGIPKFHFYDLPSDNNSSKMRNYCLEG